MSPIVRQTSLLGGFADLSLLKPPAAMASQEPAAKRLRTAPAENFYEVDVSTLQLKEGKHGCEWLQPDRFNLTPEQPQWLSMPFGIEIKNFEKISPGFITGDAKNETKHLDAMLQISPQLAERFIALETFLRAASRSKGVWNDLVKDGGETKGVKAKIYFLGPQLTTFTIKEKDGVKHRGSGWEFLKPFAEKYANFHDLPVKLSVKISTWSGKGKRGVTLRADQMFIDASHVPEPFDEFADV
jgi:hypothetical protein